MTTTTSAGRTPVSTSREPIATQSARAALAAVRYLGNALARAREALHGFEELAALLLGDGRVARRQRAGDAVAHVVVEDLEGETLERRRDRPDLGEDVDAVPLVLDHALDAPHLPFDPVQALDERILVLDVAVGHVRASLGLRKRRSRSEFETTKRLEPAMAAAATIGFSRPATARGIAATL